MKTTAVELALGTGGFHFVTGILHPSAAVPTMPLPGHLIKMRYTPFQCAVRVAEEDWPGIVGSDLDLELAPVVACELHSQAPAVAAGFLRNAPTGRVVYIMTDGAALPMAFSKLAPAMKKAGLVAATITVGQAFGGDLEAINVYSALLLARHVLRADLVIVGQGPGNAGTGTTFGFSGIEQGETANAAASLGGIPIICLRASTADPRNRHQTPCHHTLTVLDRVARCRCTVPIARDVSGARRRLILYALQDLGLDNRHDLVTSHPGGPGLSLLKELGMHVTTMGRSMDEDREYFLHASAAGASAAETVMLKTSHPSPLAGPP
jgi:hypothetical protein